MRRLAAAVLAATALLAFTAVPTQAQDIADLPRLGYEIDPTRGFVGDEVHSDVNVDDLREHCWDTPAGTPVQVFSGEMTAAQWVASFSIELWSYVQPTSLIQVMNQFDNALNLGLLDAWEQRYGPAPTTNPIYDFIGETRTGTPPEGIPDDQDGQDFVDFTGAALQAASGLLGIGQLWPALYPAVHISTFVDPATQELLGTPGTFDPDTGQGTMEVPELPPGLYAMVAACAFFPPAGQFPADYNAGLVAAWQASVACEEAGGDVCFPTGAGVDDWSEWAAEVGFPALFGAMFAPRAVGIDFYCILDDDGFCAVPPEPVGLIADDVIDEFNGDDPLAPGPGAEGLEDLADAEDLVAVQATPAFTG